jgi:hypothetical protein
MKKYAASMFVSVVFLALVSPVGFGLIRTSLIKSPSPPAPTAVPGSVLSNNEAIPKPGYEFISRGTSVDVVKIRTNQIMGTYVCPCTKADKTGTCEVVFQPQAVTCKGGSCTGETCRLTAARKTMRQ